MKRKENKLITINSLSELHKLSGLPKPKNPLIGLINLGDISIQSQEPLSLVLNFYTISIKRCFDSKLKYGQNYYDFDEGVLVFMEPGQIISYYDCNQQPDGLWLIFHPDLIRHYPLGKNIKNLGFFSYSVNEALHLSESEEAMVETILKNIETEYNHSIDQYSQDVMVSQLELLLNYSNRFYNRQFITRKTASNDLLIKMEALLDEYFTSGKMLEFGLPTVQQFADKLNLSSNYLSDLLRTLTGQSTQQHIQNKLIEKAKEALTTTNLSVSEIAYQLGFGHPQSFSKMFKNKMNVSPLEYRASFN
ncbi:helix-turn-helix transcriptional regulator [Pedobacter sp. ISL-68]|uniref:helix-turn-helix domain-containing protein n=1 Tax=unclassified Pedobacter TaxID=2628915 RepID=UPI001BECB83D|nr:MULTISPECIES: helix-turn-helix transcriptional regulator [unclassified Pedobacter]MBT2560704.1 helix-turn-helix transcriptional regulator [Pedobacter sp. ISL-64]MBT2590083.1 helix-turn-helix transcriptional regulator [Pedobacter sp. ISL-68]